MLHSNVLSRLFQQSLGLAALVALTAFAGAARADGATDFSLLAFFAPQESSVPAASHDALAVHEIKPIVALPETIDLTAPTDNLWVRIRNGFSMPNLGDEVVLHHQQWYLNRPDMLRRMVERSRRYMHHIVEELEKRGMPTELALLPMVESSFNPMAYSPARASGLWQFIPATGKRYNLTQDWWQDQRRDIVASTEAALDYLQTIYEMNGDWHLALASYNWGENAVKRAVEKNQARGLPTDFSSLTMPAETRNYVPKLQALKNIFGNPQLMAELRLPELLNQPYFATVETDRPIDVATAARLAGVPVAEFVALNPAHNRPVIKRDSTVVLPADRIDDFQAALENPQQPLTRWQAYTLKPGERLDRLARRFGMPLSELRQVNGLQARARVGAGSTLLVPALGGATARPDLADYERLPRINVEEPQRDRRSVSRGGSSAGKSRGSAIVKASRTASPRSVKTSAGSGFAKAKPVARKLAARGSTPRDTARAPAKPAKVARSGNGRRG